MVAVGMVETVEGEKPMGIKMVLAKTKVDSCGGRRSDKGEQGKTVAMKALT